MKKTVKIISILATIGCIANIVIMAISLASEETNWKNFLAVVLSNIISTILCWALYVALTKTEKLEKDVAELKSNEKQVRKIQNEVKQLTEEVSADECVCKVCGNKLAPEDKFCPRCMAPRGKSNK